MRQVTLAKNAGFCFGVKRATDYVSRLLREPAVKKIYTLGTLIHNRRYIGELEEKGVFSITIQEAERVAAESDTLGKTVLLIRTHGIPRDEENALRALEKKHPAFHVEDMTCPFVKRIHRIADTETNEDTRFLLLGAKDHAECIGILSHVTGEAAVFSTTSELEAYLGASPARPTDTKAVIAAAQTTGSVSEWKKTQKYLKKLYTNAKIFDTICNVTETRQQEALALAGKSDCMIVIGCRDSSNTQKLYQLCKEICPDTYLVEHADELPDLSERERISITAGASTPDGIIMEVYHKMSMEDYASLLDETLKPIHTGDIVVGTVLAVTDKCVYLDLGTKQTGLIEADKLVADPSAKITSLYKVGDQIKAFVVRVDDKEGSVSLDKLRVDRDAGWYTFVEEAKTNPIKEGTVTAVVKGGLTMDIEGYRVFVPASQSGVAKDGDLSALVGTTQKVKIIDIDEERKRTVASIKSYQYEARKIARAERDAARDEAFSKLEVGQKYVAKIKNLTSYGAFVDLGGIDGMIHKSELSWRNIKNPAQVVSVGQEVEVYIKELDPETHRISLGYKTPEMDEFTKFASTHSVGDIVSAKIVSIVSFGAFAEVAEGVDGLIHNSRISLEHVDKPENYLTVGQVVDAQITGIDTEKRQLALSIRAILEAQKRAEDAAAREAERAEAQAAAKAEAEERAKERAEMAPYIVGSID
ncbi:MAG: 4-hydroxy-3-methylbut-2-enyl diphosphate reductase [Clostridia bacterium]|nr:4-hydroxy-3-methylbut-2-enyl diphosphate reductase [Clostridia bacterium]MDY6184339.1 4-hydroxy-3-methylbut-2-enyl diphosphate reductase [Eubacteriales bacterium]